MKKSKIAHVTSVHICSDSRILYRECTSLSNNGFDVTLLASNVDNNIVKENPNIKFISTYKANFRLYRWLITLPIIVFKSLYKGFDVVHLHDPELFIFVPLYKLLGKKVVLDIHEDYFSTLKEKHYLPSILRSFISKAFALFFGTIVNKADLIICAWPKICEILSFEYKVKGLIIRNFPNIELFRLGQNIEKENKEITFLFSGVVSFERGIKEAVKIVSEIRKLNIDAKFHIVGRFKSIKEEEYIKSLKYDWIKCDQWAPQSDLYKIMKNATFGFILFHDIPNHRYSEPNKLYEYMSVGLPSIVNKLPLLSQIISETNAGVIIDINNIDVNDIIYKLNNNTIYSQMSSNGVEAVQSTYNWSHEESKLIFAYKNLVC